MLNLLDHYWEWQCCGKDAGSISDSVLADVTEELWPVSVLLGTLWSVRVEPEFNACCWTPEQAYQPLCEALLLLFPVLQSKAYEKNTKARQTNRNLWYLQCTFCYSSNVKWLVLGYYISLDRVIWDRESRLIMSFFFGECQHFSPFLIEV